MNSTLDEEFMLFDRRRPRHGLARQLLSPSILAVFFLSILWLGTTQDWSQKDTDLSVQESSPQYYDDQMGASGKHPDFGQYAKLRTITEDELGLEEAGRRLIVVGDVHGMADSLQKLLDKVSYDQKSDTLIHLGDLVARGSHSSRVLSQFASRNVTGVRGNHDQKAIQWRAFMNWVKEQHGGKEWFEELDAMDLTPREYKKLRKSKKKFETPDEDWGSEHWHIAKKMSQDEYDYLRGLPLAIHLPSLHTFLVHAGLLASDPTLNLYNSRQPLAHAPSDNKHSGDVDYLRGVQELSILSDVPQNHNAWNRLNIRDVTKKGKVSRKAGAGIPWADLWNDAQRLCKGFDSSVMAASDFDFGEGLSGEDLAKLLKKKRLPCYPTSIIYGHAAKRGLDIKRWSTGLDTGCSYGRRLTALVFGDRKHKGIDDAAPDEGDEELEEMRFGDSYKARVVSVRCHKP